MQNDNNYEYDDVVEEDGDSELSEAIINTRPQEFVAQKGETVRLPCEAKNAGRYLFIYLFSTNTVTYRHSEQTDKQH